MNTVDLIEKQSLDMTHSTSIITRAIFSLIILCIACGKSNDKSPHHSDQTGFLYYSAADDLIRFDFSTRREISIFSEGNNYRIALDGQQFVWYKNDPWQKTTHIQVHRTQAPDDYFTITLPYLLESTPSFAPNEELLAALTASTDDPITRKDLLLFNYQGENIGRIPHVKDFAFAPNGKDLVIAAEAINGTNRGYALAVIKDYRSASSQQSITIHEFADYNLLPTDLAVAPNSSALAFTHSDHLYTVDLVAGATLKQITQSRFKEVDVNWSPNGEYLIFVANVTDNLGCGEIRIIPSSPKEIIVVPDDGVDNAPADPLQPIDQNGKVIHSCGSENIFWHE